MTTFYPDVSHFQSGMSVRGVQLVCAKATQGTGFKDAAYPNFRAQAKSLGIPLIPYHYLEAGSPAQQAEFAFSVCGHDGPLMLDVETGSGGVPGVLAFAARYKALGGNPRLVYLPHWYWDQLGQPDLRPLAAAGLLLVASHYGVPYSDTGPGWAPYGGVQPTAWQYTDAQPLNGVRVDFNAYRGTVAEFVALLGAGPAPQPQGDDMTPAEHAMLAELQVGVRALLWAWQPTKAEFAAAGGDPAIYDNLIGGIGGNAGSNLVPRLFAELGKVQAPTVDSVAVAAALDYDKLAVALLQAAGGHFHVT